MEPISTTFSFHYTYNKACMLLCLLYWLLLTLCTNRQTEGWIFFYNRWVLNKFFRNFSLFVILCLFRPHPTPYPCSNPPPTAFEVLALHAWVGSKKVSNIMTCSSVVWIDSLLFCHLWEDSILY